MYYWPFQRRQWPLEYEVHKKKKKFQISLLASYRASKFNLLHAIHFLFSLTERNSKTTDQQFFSEQVLCFWVFVLCFFKPSSRMTGQQQQGFISHPQLLVVPSRCQHGTRSFSDHGREESGNCCKSSEVILPVCSKDDCLRHQTPAPPHSHSEACCPYTLFLHVLPTGGEDIEPFILFLSIVFSRKDLVWASSK